MDNDTEANVKPDTKRRGLGRGLNALFEDEEGTYPQADAHGHTPGTQRMMMPVAQLEPGSYQPRRIFTEESLAELAASIAEHGVLQPLIVRPKNGFDGIYEIIAGERRWRASQRAQIHEVPVIIRELSDGQALEIALIENLQREDLNPLDEARGYKQLIEEFGHTQEKAAKILGKSRSHVANMMRLLTLPRSVLDLINEGKLSAGHARALVTAENPEELAKFIMDQAMTVRDAEKLAAQRSASSGRKTVKPTKDVDTLALEEEIGNALGMKVSIDVKAKGAGTLKIGFANLDQLDEVLHRLSHFPGRQQTG